MRCNPLINEHFTIKRLVEKNKALSQELRVVRKHGTKGAETTDEPDMYTFKVCIDHDENNIIDTDIRGPLMPNWEIDNDTMEAIIESVKDKGLKYIEYAVSRARIIDNSVIVIGLTRLSNFAKIPDLSYSYNDGAASLMMDLSGITFDSIYTAPVMGIIDLTQNRKVDYASPFYVSSTHNVSLNDNIDIRYWNNVPEILNDGMTRYVPINPIYRRRLLYASHAAVGLTNDIINLSYATDSNWCSYTDNDRVLLTMSCGSTINKLILNSNLKNKYPRSNKQLRLGTTPIGSNLVNITINNLHSSQEIYDLLKANDNITIHNFTKVGAD